jgi:hypothetical protein
MSAHLSNAGAVLALLKLLRVLMSVPCRAVAVACARQLLDATGPSLLLRSMVAHADMDVWREALACLLPLDDLSVCADDAAETVAQALKRRDCSDDVDAAQSMLTRRCGGGTSCRCWRPSVRPSTATSSCCSTASSHCFGATASLQRAARRRPAGVLRRQCVRWRCCLGARLCCETAFAFSAASPVPAEATLSLLSTPTSQLSAPQSRW